MTNLRLISVVAAVAIPLVARAQPAPAPAPAPADELEMDGDCDAAPTCMAAKLADALSAQPSERALQLHSLITFDGGTARVYSTSREKLGVLASSWHQHPRWTMITVDGYADAGGTLELAQRRADRVRGYLIRYGVAPDYVVAIGHDPAGDQMPVKHPTRGHVDLTIGSCEQDPQVCRVAWLAAAAGSGARPSNRP